MQTEPVGGDFPVAPPMFWTDCDDAVDTDHDYDPDTGTFTAPYQPTPAEIAAAILAEIAADLDRADNIVLLELLLPVYAALREAVPDFETKPYFPPWLAGVATKAEFRQAVIDRRKAVRDALAAN